MVPFRVKEQTPLALFILIVITLLAGATIIVGARRNEQCCPPGGNSHPRSSFVGRQYDSTLLFFTVTWFSSETIAAVSSHSIAGDKLTASPGELYNARRYPNRTAQENT